jgi:L-methionine (R)-S-oxide reductase
MSLLNEIESCLNSNESSQTSLQMILALILNHLHCSVGTIHILGEPSGMLMLHAAKGVPDVVLDRVRSIPIGKGMAGLAAERRQPVQVCNLQSDQSGVAKPIARETKMAGSIAVPMMVGKRLYGVLGVAKAVTYEFDQAEIGLLLQIGRLIAKQFDHPAGPNPLPSEA